MPKSAGSSSSNVSQNQQEAENLYKLAKKLIKEDPDRAENLIRKAERLHPSPQAQELLNLVEQSRTNRGPRSSTRPSRSDSSKQTASTSQALNDGGRRRRLPSDRPGEQNYTMEQIEAVRRVARCYDYYEVLQVSTEATTEEILTSYKKLMMVLHPDKNPAPGAKQATQEVLTAKNTLTDPQKRRNYDMQRQAETIVLPTRGNFDESMALFTMGLMTAGVGLLFMFLDNIGRRPQRRS